MNLLLQLDVEMLHPLEHLIQTPGHRAQLVGPAHGRPRGQISARHVAHRRDEHRNPAMDQAAREQVDQQREHQHGRRREPERNHAGLPPHLIGRAHRDRHHDAELAPHVANGHGGGRERTGLHHAHGTGLSGISRQIDRLRALFR